MKRIFMNMLVSGHFKSKIIRFIRRHPKHRHAKLRRSNMTLKKMQIVLLAVVVAIPMLVFSQDKLSGLEIMQKVYDRPTGNDMEASLTMTLINSRGSERVREIKQNFRTAAWF